MSKAITMLLTIFWIATLMYVIFYNPKDKIKGGQGE